MVTSVHVETYSNRYFSRWVTYLKNIGVFILDIKTQFFTIKDRVARDPSFSEELLKEGIECLLTGDVDTGKTAE